MLLVHPHPAQDLVLIQESLDGGGHNMCTLNTSNHSWVVQILPDRHFLELDRVCGLAAKGFCLVCLSRWEILLSMAVLMSRARSRGWREPGNSIQDPGITRTEMGFLVLLLYETT